MAIKRYDNDKFIIFLSKGLKIFLSKGVSRISGGPVDPGKRGGSRIINEFFLKRTLPTSPPLGVVPESIKRSVASRGNAFRERLRWLDASSSPAAASLNTLLALYVHGIRWSSRIAYKLKYVIKFNDYC